MTHDHFGLLHSLATTRLQLTLVSEGNICRYLRWSISNRYKNVVANLTGRTGSTEARYFGKITVWMMAVEEMGVTPKMRSFLQKLEWDNPMGEATRAAMASVGFVDKEDEKARRLQICVLCLFCLHQLQLRMFHAQCSSQPKGTGAAVSSSS